MKVAVVFILFFATVICRPARRYPVSSSESSEEAVRRPPPRYMRKPVPWRPRFRAAEIQNVPAVSTAAESDESKQSSDEVQVAAEAPAVEFKFNIFDATVVPDTTTENSQDSTDSEDSDDDDDDSEENDTDEDDNDSDDTSESGESSTVAPTAVSPVVTEEPVVETTMDPLEPTIITDTDSGRGDSLGGYPSDYKSIYEEDKSYHKVPSPYKSYEYYDSGKKMSYDKSHGNEVEKSMKVYKAIQVHSDLLEEDTSTPEVESQGLDASSYISQDQEVGARQAPVPEEEQNAIEATTSESESSSTTQEEEEEEEEEESASSSVDSEDEDSQSSEEATATPGAADSDSDESDSDEDGVGPFVTTEVMVVVTAK